MTIIFPQNIRSAKGFIFPRKQITNFALSGKRGNDSRYSSLRNFRPTSIFPERKYPSLFFVFFLDFNWQVRRRGRRKDKKEAWRMSRKKIAKSSCTYAPQFPRCVFLLRINLTLFFFNLKNPMWAARLACRFSIRKSSRFREKKILTAKKGKSILIYAWHSSKIEGEKSINFLGAAVTCGGKAWPAEFYFCSFAIGKPFCTRSIQSIQKQFCFIPGSK